MSSLHRTNEPSPEQKRDFRARAALEALVFQIGPIDSAATTLEGSTCIIKAIREKLMVTIRSPLETEPELYFEQDCGKFKKNTKYVPADLSPDACACYRRTFVELLGSDAE